MPGVAGSGGPLTAAGMDNLFAQTTQYMMDPKDMSLNTTNMNKRDEFATPTQNDKKSNTLTNTNDKNKTD